MKYNAHKYIKCPCLLSFFTINHIHDTVSSQAFYEYSPGREVSKFYSTRRFVTMFTKAHTGDCHETVQFNPHRHFLFLQD